MNLPRIEVREFVRFILQATRMWVQMTFYPAGKYDQVIAITSARVPIVKFYMREWYVGA